MTGAFAAHDAVVVLHDVERVDAAIVLALAVDRRVSQRDRLDAVLGAVELAEVLADQLGAAYSAVAGWNGRQVGRRGFVDQARRRIAVDGDRRREYHLLDVAVAARLEDVDLSLDIDREPEARVLAERQRQEAGDREHAIAALEGIVQLVDPQDIARARA